MFTSALLFFFACGEEEKQDTAAEVAEEAQAETEDSAVEEAEDSANKEAGGEE